MGQTIFGSYQGRRRNNSCPIGNKPYPTLKYYYIAITASPLCVDFLFSEKEVSNEYSGKGPIIDIEPTEPEEFLSFTSLESNMTYIMSIT